MPRCFIALNLPFEIRKLLHKKAESFYKEDLFKGKVTELENFHLTLKFLGDVDEEKINQTKNLLKSIKTKSFQAKLGNLGVFDKKFVRIIWAKLENCDKLQKEVDNKLKDIFKPEIRFMSHVTIARVKSYDKNKLIKEIEKTKITGDFVVDFFELMRSELTSSGPVYSVMERFKLC